MDSLRIALAQIDGTVGDLAGNSERIAAVIERARSEGADLVIFPELALSGYPPGDLLLRHAFLDADRTTLQGLLEQSEGIAVIIGCLDTPGSHTEVPGDQIALGRSHYLAPELFNAAAVIKDGELVGFYRKKLLSPRTPLDELRYFQAGNGSALYRIGGCLVGITIGHEIEAGAPLVAPLVEAGADLIINLAAAPYQREQRQQRRERFSDLAREYGITLAYVNRVGGQDGLVFDGGSMVLAPSGEVLAEARPLHPELLLFDLPAANHGEKRNRNDAHAEADSIESPPAPIESLAETYEALTIGIRDYARKNGFAHLVLGLSGGIDSALVATLAADALSADAVTAVWMPSRYSSELSRVDAVALADALGIDLLTIPIEAAYSSYLELLEPHFGGRAQDLTEENLQARIRGNLLMALSNKFGWLVLTTSNKSETAVGYSTLYGDMAGGLAPLKDVYKTLVYRLAHWRNSRGAVIPESTIERPPTAELRSDQLDTDSLPTYDILDGILERYLEQGWSAAEIVADGADPATVNRLVGLVTRGEYKRRQAPPGIKITNYAFGVDDQMPMTSRFREVIE
jgi:NAD+ synthase (glutamine-hydrolysing)